MMSPTAILMTAVIVLSSFLPLTALSYNLFRHDRSTLEINRILDLLQVDSDYRNVFVVAESHKFGEHLQLFWAVAYATVISCIGLSMLLLAPQLGFTEFPKVEVLHFPQPGSRLIFGMAFLGAYVWGLHYIFQRYSLNDLVSTVYYSLGIRMLLASLTALVMYNATDSLLGSESGEIMATLWPALAFLIGMFPRSGLRWLMERVPMLSSEEHPSVRRAPLTMIEGIGSYDSLRLEELGIDTCYDLATADFVPLILKTPYSARQLVDWILQAKLCACFGEGVKDLRTNGLRTIIDLKALENDDLEELAAETSLTRSALRNAKDAVRADLEIKRLQRIGTLLSQFTRYEAADQDSTEVVQAEQQRAVRAERSLTQLHSKLQQQGIEVDSL
ncbi:DNA polymerase IV [Acaryochloris thomasi RCC1774]|uniref:DNA polymerase IV n=1 Tax=Acaryochloris thomasi RCC1774 TaxID=1764569 RepID=A0A2W1JY07_9CYAN|nr:hypothetical protein [Acaryochloris thomasi]PZD73481.1 DNA polymerase IV [Acaryochloris thomasi RCC1774]